MRVITRRRLVEFWSDPRNPRCQPSLEAWYKTTQDAAWVNFADVRRTFNTADLVGRCTVFDIGGNNYRLIARILYPRCVYILRVMDHDEYDRRAWVESCECHSARRPARARPPRRKKR